ncbi:hypothetical protein SAMN05660841_00225 [Sphingobacterium nematocida]|uniref:DUF4142 domain-containing protein n=1 Tax=Sphingobacterium nematocida TaxID=1513896 RepID=A0A1T5AWR9_9SPHI|nr:hypothetical protein [Sphingobacterium nematocida]SKB39210.1 hypothetical protein SAMN05660841_00225 [Sphingobacterium nematocida]
MNIEVWALLFLFIIPTPRSEAQSDPRENEVLRTIVFMRTEGLGMIDLLNQHTHNKEVKALCVRMKTYYVETQPETVELCRGKDLQLDEKDVDLLLSRLKKGFENYKPERDSDYLLLFEEHINKSIQLYAEIVQEQRWENISHFSFTALPELFNLQQEIRKLKKK